MRISAFVIGCILAIGLVNAERQNKCGMHSPFRYPDHGSTKSYVIYGFHLDNNADSGGGNTGLLESHVYNNGKPTLCVATTKVIPKQTGKQVYMSCAKPTVGQYLQIRGKGGKKLYFCTIQVAAHIKCGKFEKFNWNKGSCLCKYGKTGGSCRKSCPANTTHDGEHACNCNKGFVKSGSGCKSTSCGANMSYNRSKHVCECNKGFKKSGKSCARPAAKPKAIQSTTDYGGVPQRAIDGNRNPRYYPGKSCTHTKLEYEPWWSLDMGRQVTIGSVAITNRFAEAGVPCGGPKPVCKRTAAVELLSNPSFESGRASANSVEGLTSWYSMNRASPDAAREGTIAERWNRSNKPSNGMNYITMWARGSHQEGISQDLARPLQPGKTYTLTLDAISSAGTQPYFKPTNIASGLEIYGNSVAHKKAGGGLRPAGHRLLAKYNIRGTSYKRYTITLKPTFIVRTLSLTVRAESRYPSLIIDNLHLKAAGGGSCGSPAKPPPRPCNKMAAIELITNPSFESGRASANSVDGLTSWYSMNKASPDAARDGTSAERWNRSNKPSNGRNYITMWARGSHQEGISQDLARPLQPGKTYTLTLDAISAAGSRPWFKPTNIASGLEIYGNAVAHRKAGGGLRPAGHRLLARYNIRGASYKRYTITLKPTFIVRTLSLTVRPESRYPSLILDNLHLKASGGLCRGKRSTPPRRSSCRAGEHTLHNFEVAITNTAPPARHSRSQVCFTRVPAFKGRLTQKCARALSGRYLVVRMKNLKRKRYLTLCEVQYFK